MRAIRAFRPSSPTSRCGPTRSRRSTSSTACARAGMSVGIVRAPVGEPERIASVPLARVPVDHVAVPPGHRLAGVEVVDVPISTASRCFVVDRSDAPTAHDEIEAYCTSVGARPRWVNHAATQVERVLDMVAVGAGIGWLNSWQVEREVGRTDVVVQAAASGGAVRRVPGRVAGGRHRDGHRRRSCVWCSRPAGRRRRGSGEAADRTMSSTWFDGLALRARDLGTPDLRSSA